MSYWAYQLQGLSQDGAVDALAASRYDMLIVEPTRTDWSSGDMGFDTSSMVRRLKAGKASDGVRDKLILAYVNVGEAENWRWYWKWSAEWKSGRSRPADWPDFILALDPDGWEGDYPVAYWDDRWKDILIYGANQTSAPHGDYSSILDEVVRDGFDGVFLDWVEGYENEAVVRRAESEGRDPVAEMVRLISEIRSYGRARNRDFLVIQQNGSSLGPGHPEIYGIVDAISQESVWFGGVATGDWDDPSGHDMPADSGLTAEYIARLSSYRAAGLPVFVCEYAVARAPEAYSAARAAGFVPYCSRTPLSRLTTTPPPGM